MARLVAMKIMNRTKKTQTQETGVIGVARAERDNLRLSHKLKSGNIAVVDHIDLDRAHAEMLIERGVRAVINVSPSTSGRYPNLGPQMLAHAGIMIIDHVGPAIFSKFKSGNKLRLDDGNVFRDDVLIATGTELTDARINDLLRSAESGLSIQLESLAVNAAEHLRREREMLLEDSGIPGLTTKLRDRPVLVVSKSYEYETDLRGLRGYISDHDPVLIGAGSGADALLEFGYVPDLVVGALDNISDRGLKESGEVVITSASGEANSVERLEKAGADAVMFVGTGSDEDLALMLADANDASVIVLAGGHTSLVEFLDRGPTNMASTFLARLKIGTKLVDAKAVHEFYNHRISAWPIVLLAIAGVIAVAVAIAATPVGQSWFDSIPDLVSDATTWIKGLNR